MVHKQNEDQKKDMRVMKLDLQISSNMRICVGFKDSGDPRYSIGASSSDSFITEHHVISFERYVNMPFELKALRQKQLLKAKNDKDVDTVNPWLITDIDYFGNPLVKSKAK